MVDSCIKREHGAVSMPSFTLALSSEDRLTMRRHFPWECFFSMTRSCWGCCRNPASWMGWAYCYSSSCQKYSETRGACSASDFMLRRNDCIVTDSEPERYSADQVVHEVLVRVFLRSAAHSSALSRVRTLARRWSSTGCLRQNASCFIRSVV